MKDHKGWRWILLLIAVVWTALSWRWYTCQIKGFCETTVASVPGPAQVTVPAAPEATTRCATYLQGPIRLDRANDAREVRRLEAFLKEYEGATIDVDGIYTQDDERAVRVFQQKYRDDILTPWDIAEPTGHVMQTTTAKINELYCSQR